MSNALALAFSAGLMTLIVMLRYLAFSGAFAWLTRRVRPGLYDGRVRAAGARACPALAPPPLLPARAAPACPAGPLRRAGAADRQRDSRLARQHRHLRHPLGA